MKIWISQAGDVELNGQSSNIDTVEKALEDLSKRGGAVVYGADAWHEAPHPNVRKLFVWVARQGLPSRLSHQRDFSDVLDPGGILKD